MIQPHSLLALLLFGLALLLLNLLRAGDSGLLAHLKQSLINFCIRYVPPVRAFF
jgi:hypothetical protein